MVGVSKGAGEPNSHIDQGVQEVRPRRSPGERLIQSHSRKVNIACLGTLATTEHFHHFLDKGRLLFLLLGWAALVVLQGASSWACSRLQAHQVGIAVLELCLGACWRSVHVHLASQPATPFRHIAPRGAACSISSVLPHGCHAWLCWRTRGRGLCCV